MIARRSSGSSRVVHPWVTPALMTRKTRNFAEIRAVEGWVLWQESRPDEQGRSVIVGCAPDGSLHDLTPPDAQPGTEMHVYGGGAWAAMYDGAAIHVVFSDRKRGGLWRSVQGGEAQPVCGAAYDEGGIAYSYADLAFQGERLVCVREAEHPDGVIHAELVEVMPSGVVCSLQSGADFYMAPRLSPDGRFLAFIAWQNPHMPWTETGLYVQDLTGAQGTMCLAGGAGHACSVMGPFWAGERLYALSDGVPEHAAADYNRHWTPIAFEAKADAAGEEVTWQPQPLPPAPAEIGLPAWVFGQSCCAALPEGQLLARGVRHGVPVTLLYHPQTGWKDVLIGAVPDDVPVPVEGGRDFAWLNSPPDAPPCVMMGSLESEIEGRICVRQAWVLPDGVTPADIAVPETVSFPVEEGPGPLYAQFYRPAQGPHCEAVQGKPPLVVIVHGGPTGQARTDLSFKVQWWTCRGFAVLDVNYRGSTGFGRAYRAALDGRWGVLDVQDCCRAVQGVVDKGWVDPQRCVIRGSSAGGLTVLSALAHSSLFVAGTSLYGVTDLRGLVAETHRFEACYLDGLIAPWPEGEAVYRARSPLSWPAAITAPVLFLHGDADRVVPLSQAEALQSQLSASSLHIYQGEGHGFRSAEVIAESLERELAFYRDVFAQAAV
ncbi:S9 family peptidase [Bombella pollinis]|uniref:Prolyl oligopeptidase family serine peptidase n=1 Tax=Bombella pollinis TaxID=2967337 RepID=A0ABT3WLR1_9PROT|nr:prolyl oligopeptidase family serine peptidase [Bombella pollinis]MCX5619110.1 prolyl oligopeptidase family serine peptidase [Bombella pollinis]